MKEKQTGRDNPHARVFRVHNRILLSHNPSVAVSHTTGQEGRRSTLVIGYGSTLRGDDGVGPRVAELIERMRIPGVEVMACHQLTPELSELIANASRVIFVDASIDLPDDQVQVRKVEAEGQRQVMVHTASPAGLLHLARSVFGRCPAAWVVAVPVAEMGIGERLSEFAEAGAQEAVRQVQALLDTDP